MARNAREYEILVAGLLLRVPQFSATYGPLLLDIRGAFFQDFFLRDVVTYALEYWNTSGRLLPAAALKADTSVFARDGASQDNYEEAIDAVFDTGDDALLQVREHVEKKIVEETQARILLQTDMHEYCTPSKLQELYSLIDRVRTLAATKGGVPRRIGEGLLDELRAPVRGLPTGLPDLDHALSARGIAPGETLLYFGRYSIGKSMLIHHSVRTAALSGHVAVLWSFETSERNTRNRIVKAMLDVDDDWLRDHPEEAFRMWRDRYDKLPLYVHYSPPGSTTKAQILSYLDRVEQQEGRKVEILGLDYSEKRVHGRDWNTVADAYQELREICGERRMAGVDAAQENAKGDISYFNLLKDADIGIQLTVMRPDEWRKRQKSMQAQEDIRIPPAGPVWGEVVRAREGRSGDVFAMWIDRARGRIEPRYEIEEEE